jgi:aconitase B
MMGSDGRSAVTRVIIRKISLVVLVKCMMEKGSLLVVIRVIVQKLKPVVKGRSLKVKLSAYINPSFMKIYKIFENQNYSVFSLFR